MSEEKLDPHDIVKTLKASLHDTYAMEYRCDNCGGSFKTVLKKGVRADTLKCCARCGCATAQPCRIGR